MIKEIKCFVCNEIMKTDDSINGKLIYNHDYTCDIYYSFDLVRGKCNIQYYQLKLPNRIFKLIGHRYSIKTAIEYSNPIRYIGIQKFIEPKEFTEQEFIKIYDKVMKLSNFE